MIISDNDECVDHEESGTKPTFAANDFGSGTGDEGDKDACMTRLIINRWFGRDMGLTTINSAGGGGGCASCPNWNLVPPLSTMVAANHCGPSEYRTYAAINGLANCSRATFITWMHSSGNFFNAKGCGYIAPPSILNANHWAGSWQAQCTPCTTNSDCAPSGTTTFGTQTKGWTSSVRCYDSSGAQNSGNPGYCAWNFNDATGCARTCNT